MRVYTKEDPCQSLLDGDVSFSKTAIALGGFDALHLGHQAIISHMVQKAKAEGLTAVVSLFRNHPKDVIGGTLEPSVYPLKKRLELLEEMGVDVVLAEWFTPEYKEILPETFVKKHLKERLDARYVTVGFNYRFGKGGMGDKNTLKKLCAPLGIDVCDIDAVRVDGKTVSSTRIRSLIQEGNMPGAERCLGRSFSLTGTVITGNRLGRTIDFPTANITCPSGVILPRLGVYLARVKAMGTWHPAICHVGARPTVNDTQVFIEAHLLNFQGVLYDTEIEIAFCSYLRETSRFQDLTELKKQLEKDKVRARNFFL